MLAISGALALAAGVPVLLGAALAVAAAAIAAFAIDLARGPGRADLRVMRLPVGPLALRKPATFRYRVENRSGANVRVGLLEAPLETIAGAEGELHAAVPAGAFGEVQTPVSALERGEVPLGDVYGWFENELGLVRRRFAAAAPEAVRVFPDLSAVERYGTLARRSTLLEAGFRKLRLRGAGTEFESLRDYVTGDGFRQVNWKATARRGRMTVEQYEIERSQNVLVALDAGRLMLPRIGPQRKFDYALTGGLSVARIAERAGDNVGFLAFAAKPLLSIAPRRGAAHVNALARAAYDLQPRLEEPDYEMTFAAIKGRYAKRSLIVLFSDMFDPVTSAAVLAGLSSLIARHLVMCVLMNDEAIAAALDTVPASAHDAYRTSVAMDLADEREKAIAGLRALGIITIDVPASQLTVALLDAYLDVKARGLI